MSSTATSWAPDESLFEMVDGDARGILLVKEALRAANLDPGRIITSRDPSARTLRDKLQTGFMPPGFEQHQLPVLLPGANAICFLTTGLPNAEFPEHRHSQTDGLRVVVNGSIIYEGTELTAGDWMFVPRGASYSFRVGESGCTLYHHYPIDA